VVVVALFLSPAAQAQGGPQSATSPFSPGLPVNPGTAPTATAPQTQTTLTSTTTTGGSGGLSGSAAVAIGAGALIVLGGISFFIWWDARRRAPVRPGAAATAGVPGSRARPKSRKLSPAERKRRKRGKAR